MKLTVLQKHALEYIAGLQVTGTPQRRVVVNIYKKGLITSDRKLTAKGAELLGLQVSEEVVYVNFKSRRKVA